MGLGRGIWRKTCVTQQDIDDTCGMADVLQGTHIFPISVGKKVEEKSTPVKFLIQGD